MHLTVAALCWLSLAARVQPVPPAPCLFVVSRATEFLEWVLEDAQYIQLRLGRRLCALVEDAGYYAKQAHVLVLWQNTNNELYLDVYQTHKRLQELTIRGRAAYDESERRYRELSELARRYKRAVEAERRMNP
jgi:hypothetical protein